MENKARENGDDDEKKENDLVMRVNREVFDLEQVLYKGQGKDMISALGAMEGVDQQGDDENEMGWGWTRNGKTRLQWLLRKYS